MPILVTCPKCATKLNAPDSAAGKAVRCPRSGCGTVVPVAALVPAEEEPVVEGKVVARPRPRVQAAPVEDEEERIRKSFRDEDDDRPRKQSRRDEDDNDRSRRRSRRDEEDEVDRPRNRRRREDDDDYDDRPRRRRYGAGRRGGSGGGGKTVGIVFAVLVGLAALGGLGYGIYRLAGGGSASKAPPPPGWKQYTYEADGFSAYFPKQPDVTGFGGPGVNPVGGMGGNPFGGMGVTGPVPTGFNIYGCGLFDFQAEHRVAVIVLRFVDDLSPTDRQRMLAEYRKKYRDGSTRSVTWLGHSADEMTGPDGTFRVVFIGNTVYMGLVGPGRDGHAKSDVEKGFFDNVELLK